MTIEPWRGKELLRTIHGSKLYGLAHEHSDDDIFIVTEYGPAKQKIKTVDGETTDVFLIGLDAFLERMYKGSHQSLEALNSPVAELDPRYAPMFRNMRNYSPLIEETYDRTIRKLATSDSFKQRRYALRLGHNLKDLRKYGRFNPRLTPAQVRTITTLVKSKGDVSSDIELMLGRTRVKVERT